MRKNSFFVFVCSLIPGAGEMYLGMMKIGAVTMTVFFGVIFVASFLNIEFILLALPVIWFYSFFNVHNLKNLSPEWLQQKDDSALLGLNGFFKGRWKNLFDKRHTLIGIAVIFIGLYSLFHTFARPYLGQLRELVPFMYTLLSNLPTLIISLAIIALGFYLLKGKKDVTTADEDDLKPYDSHGVNQ